MDDTKRPAPQPPAQPVSSSLTPHLRVKVHVRAGAPITIPSFIHIRRGG